jgi:hypothetical protein
MRATIFTSFVLAGLVASTVTIAGCLFRDSHGNIPKPPTYPTQTAGLPPPPPDYSRSGAQTEPLPPLDDSTQESAGSTK